MHGCQRRISVVRAGSQTAKKGNPQHNQLDEKNFYKMSGFVRLTGPLEKGFILIEKQIVNIKTFSNHPLTAYPEQRIITLKSDVQGEKAEMCLDIYEDVSGGKDGVPVAISCELNDKTYLLCVEYDSVILKESEVPTRIPTETCDFIFFKRDLDDKFRTLESSVKSGFFLAWSEEDMNLTLQPYDEDKRDIFSFQLAIISIVPYKGSKKTIKCHFWNDCDDLLIAHPEESIVRFEPMEPEKVKDAEDETFFMDIYRDNDGSNKGLPVIISCKVDNKTYLLCAENKNSVILKEGELPEIIPTETSELIFYRIIFSNGLSCCRIESSFYEGLCLAWSIEDPEKKVILEEYSETLNETMKFYQEMV